MLKKILYPFLTAAIIALLFSTKGVAGDPNTVLYMSFDQESKKDIISDESGYENHGRIVGKGIKWTRDGKFGGALEFDGTSKIEVEHSDSLNFKEAMTAEIWFKTKVPQKGRFFVYKVHTGGGRNYEWGLYLTTDSTNLSFYVVDPKDEVVYPTKNGDWKDNSWHFLAGTYDGKTVKCYVDGELAASKDWPGHKIRTGNGPVVIGTWGGNFFSGVLDEARLCDIARSDQQIKSDYENGYNLFALNSKGKLAATWAFIKSSRY
ncbi:MAG: LamG domain-containing protein [Candidatus Poribacteria bacterium]